MKIGIYVHSSTGNTLSVAEKLKNKLVSDGHNVVLKKIEPVGGEQKANVMEPSSIQFSPQPEISGYDHLVICAPVRGFSMSPILAAYLSRIPTLKGQKIDLFVTQAFPFAWMGGNQAINQMKKTCESKGATVNQTAIVNWSRKKSNKIEDLVNRLGN